MRRALAIAVALAAASPAIAQVQGYTGRSPRWGSVDVGFGQYLPNIDSESFPPPKPGDPTRPPASGPYAAMFGDNKPGWMFSGTVSKSLFTRYGSLDVGFKTGYFEKSGKGLVYSSGVWSRAGADSALRVVPTSAVLTYRFDWLVERYRIPVAPYGRAAFERYNWWITRGSGGAAEKGATMGWSAAGGLAFLLDAIDPQLAREFDAESGVNHTYLFFEVDTARVDDFGSSKSWILSSKGFTWLGGMTFVF